MSTETTTNPLMLEGDDLDDAREVARWGAWDDSFSFRDCFMKGGCSSPGTTDPSEEMRQSIDLASRLQIGSGYSDQSFPLNRENVETLERLARDDADSLSYQSGEPEDSIVFWTKREEVAKRVLKLIPKLRAALPPVYHCETCGHGTEEGE